MYPEGELESNRGWNRASIVFWSRKPYRPNIKTEDFQLPSGVGNLRMLAMCAFMATCLTVLYMWFPLFVAGLFVPLGGALYGGILGGTALVLTALMYMRGLRD